MRLPPALIALSLLMATQAFGQDDYASPFDDQPSEERDRAGRTPLPPPPEASAGDVAEAEEASEGDEDDSPVVYVGLPRTPRTRLPDVTADVLLPNEGQFNLFFLQYSRGLLPGLQASVHFGGYLLSLVNLTAEYQFVNRPELRASIQAGAYWFALSQLMGATLLQAHVQPRATLPLFRDVELNLGANLRLLVLNVESATIDNRDLRGEVGLLRYDEGGAWLLEARFPLLSQQNQSLSNVLGQANLRGSLLLDDLASWALVLSRDFAIGDTTHIRVGAGYRNRPGILLLDSIGNIVFQFDVYWR